MRPQTLWIKDTIVVSEQAYNSGLSLSLFLCSIQSERGGITLYTYHVGFILQFTSTDLKAAIPSSGSKFKHK